MNVFPVEPKFEIGKVGFDGKDDQNRPLDLLNRKDFGQRLTDLVDSISQPLVIALDGPWGSGKSHFLKLWAGAHKLELKGPNGVGNGQAEVIYFDAFEHDFLDDPLVSLVAKLANDAPARGFAATAMEKVKSAAGPLLKLGARIALAMGSAGGSEVVGALGDAAIGAVGKTAEEKIEDFWKAETSRIVAMSEFRAALEALTKKADGTTQKMVFIIDELDRCRPDYALQMLEIIKHFFTVPNMHFVLGANLSELENSVKARYGAGINARKYLQKFVMLEMRLPSAEINGPGISTVRKYYVTVAGRFITSTNLKNLVDDYLAPLFDGETLTIRDIQRLFSVLALLSPVQENAASGYRALIVGAAILKVLQPTVYGKLRNHSATLAEVTSVLKLRPWKTNNENRRLDRLWIIWAMMLEPNRMTVEGIPQEEIDRYEKVFDSWGDPFSWPIADTYLGDAFDTFTLPPA
jgi:hypothetical protein